VIRLNKESLSQQRLNVDDVRDQTRANVVQFWGQLQAAKAQIEAAQRQNDAAERALTGVRNEALAGQRTTQDVRAARSLADYWYRRAQAPVRWFPLLPG
jgi:outer membrane protein